MSYVIEQVELQTHDKYCQLSFLEIENFTDASGFVCKLTIRSGDFSCTERRFYFDDSHFPDAMKLLKKMDQGKACKAIIKGRWETDFISFESNDMGHVIVEGELHEHSELPQLFKFSFSTDQTVLGPLIRDLQPLLDL